MQLLLSLTYIYIYIYRERERERCIEIYTPEVGVVDDAAQLVAAPPLAVVHLRAVC